jgi:hypothetical protein
VPTTRIKLSHDLPRVWPQAQQGAPPRPTSGLDLCLGLGRRSQPRPREESQPCPRPASTSGEVSAFPDLGLGPTMLQGIHHYPTPTSCLRLRRNKTGVPSKVTPVTGNDGSPRAPMTSVALKPPTEARQRQQDPRRADSCASTGLKELLRRAR